MHYHIVKITSKGGKPNLKNKPPIDFIQPTMAFFTSKDINA